MKEARRTHSTRGAANHAKLCIAEEEERNSISVKCNIDNMLEETAAKKKVSPKEDDELKLGKNPTTQSSVLLSTNQTLMMVRMNCPSKYM